MANPSKMFEMIRLYPNLAVDPATGKVGEIYYNTASNTLRMCIDDVLPTWTDLGASISSTFQDRNALLIDGGEWSHTTTPTATLSWLAAAYIQVPGLDDTSNEIPPGSFALAPDEVLYVDINRNNNTPTLLTVALGNINTITLNQDRFIIARNVSGIMVVGDRLSLTANEKGSLNSLRTNFETQNNNLKVIGGGVLSNQVGAGVPTSMYSDTSGNTIFLQFDAANQYRAGGRIITPFTASVNQVQALLSSNGGSPTGSMFVNIYADNGSGLPGALLGSSDPTVITGIPTSPTVITFTFSTPVPTVAGTPYIYQVVPSVGNTQGNNVNIYMAQPTDVDPNNICVFSTNGGANWSTYNGDFYITIQGLVAGGNAFSWSSPAYIQVAGQSLNSNRIPAGSEDLDTGEIIYVQINRFDVATDLTPVVQPITDAMPLDSFILAYNDGTQIWLWNGERLLTGQSKQAGESVSTAVLSTIGMSSYSDETGQLRLLPSNPASNVTLMTPANKADINSQLRSLSGNNLDVFIPGYQINWQTGTVYDYATGAISQGTFTAPTSTIPAGQSRWYSITLVKTTVDANNRQLYTFNIQNSTSATTRAPYVSGGIQVGQVFLTNTAGVIQPVTYSNIIQNALGGGSGGGGVESVQFTLANNQVAPANITDALMDSTKNRGFILDYTISRRHLTLGGAKNATFQANVTPALNSQTRGTVLQPDGKLVMVGDFTTYKGVSHNRVARITVATGADDTSFTTNIGTAANSIVFGVGLQSTGKLVLGGFFTTWNGTARAKMTRLNADGTEDAAFYANLGTGFGNDVYAVAVQPDDKILVGGTFTTLNGTTRNRFVRLNADGTVDTAFYTNMGSAVDNGDIEAIKVQTDGKIIISGTFTSFNGLTRNRIVRLNANGTEDSAWYANLGSALNDRTEIALQSDGKVVLAGAYTTFNGVSRRVTRLNTDGTLDTAFNTNVGVISAGGLTGVFVDSGGRIYISGNMSTVQGQSRVNIARLSSTGLDDAAWYANLGVGGMSGSIYNFIETQGLIIMSGTVSSVTGTAVGQMVGINADIQVELQATGSINGLYRPATATWEMGAETYAGDLTGVDFSITSAGQVQYTSSNLAGTLVESFVRYLLNKI